MDIQPLPLPPEFRHALAANGGQPLFFEDPATLRRYQLAEAPLKLTLDEEHVNKKLDEGLAAAFRDLAARSPVPVEVEAGAERFPANLEAAAYFIASEGLTNAVKHSRATRVTLRAERANGSLVVSVSDDGIGGASPSPGSGLSGLSDRVEAHGGHMRLESAQGQGTTILAELPCGS